MRIYTYLLCTLIEMLCFSLSVSLSLSLLSLLSLFSLFSLFSHFFFFSLSLSLYARAKHYCNGGRCVLLFVLTRLYQAEVCRLYLNGAAKMPHGPSAAGVFTHSCSFKAFADVCGGITVLHFCFGRKPGKRVLDNRECGVAGGCGTQTLGPWVRKCASCSFAQCTVTWCGEAMN